MESAKPMQVCTNHNVAYTYDSCPACDLAEETDTMQATIDRLEGKLQDAQDDFGTAEEEVYCLQERIDSLEGAIRTVAARNENL